MEDEVRDWVVEVKAQRRKERQRSEDWQEEGSWMISDKGREREWTLLRVGEGEEGRGI